MTVVSGFMHNHPKYPSADELNERTVIYPHSGMLLSKKLTLDPQKHDESQMCYSK